MALRAMHGSVQDYLVKGQIEPHELMRAMRNSVARKILEETLFNEKNRAQITLECIGDAVICTDLAGNISFLNPVAERMTGWSLMETVGRPLTESFRIIDASTGRNRRQSHRAGHRTRPFEPLAGKLHSDPSGRKSDLYRRLGRPHQ
jgi:PAS domain-containing protein